MPREGRRCSAVPGLWQPGSAHAHKVTAVTLLPIPIICFIGALPTDLAYVASAEMMWLDFSAWLLLAGLGGVAGALLIVELVRARDRRAPSAHLVLLFAAWVIEVFNSFVHARDGWTAIVPIGLCLSIVATVLALLAGWFWQSAHRRLGETV